MIEFCYGQHTSDFNPSQHYFQLVHGFQCWIIALINWKDGRKDLQEKEDARCQNFDEEKKQHESTTNNWTAVSVLVESENTSEQVIRDTADVMSDELPHASYHPVLTKLYLERSCHLGFSMSNRFLSGWQDDSTTPIDNKNLLS